VVLVDVQAVACLDALARDARADHLRQPEQVRRPDAQARVDLLPHAFGPRLGAECREAEARLVRRDAALCEGLHERQRVARRARDDVRPQVLDERQLPLSHAARHGHDVHAEAATAVVQAEAAREEPVAVRVVERHAVLGAGHREAAGDDLREEVEISSGVADHGRLPRRARRGVDAGEPLARHREQAEGVGVAQVVLARERQVDQVVRRAQVGGLDVGEPPAVQRHPLLEPPHEPLEPLDLERPQPLPLQRLELGLEDHGASIGHGPAVR
jgi:hypothetical protein